MSKRTSQRKPEQVTWPYTPEPSPPLKSATLVQQIHIVETMETDQPTRARPISVSTRREGIMSPGRPTLEDVLNNTAPAPYTLAAYTAFLSQQHCLETLEFVTESRKYSDKYAEAVAQLKESSIKSSTDQGFELMMDWNRLLDVYVKPGAPREINLPAEERDELISCSYDPILPLPEALDPAIKRMYDLMSDSIFIPFCNSLKAPSHAQTYTALSELTAMDDMDTSRTYDERNQMPRRMQSRGQGRRSPSATSASNFEPSRSPTGHRPTQSSSLSSALSRQQANRLSTHVSQSSAISESALTDSSGGGGDTPPPGEQESVMTPPTTPPTSDIGMGSNVQVNAPTTHPIKAQRSESGGWSRKMGKFFGSGGNKKRTSFLE
jgi:hypothetical protein